MRKWREKIGKKKTKEWGETKNERRKWSGTNLKNEKMIKEKKEKEKREEKEKNQQNHGQKLANCRSSHQVTKINFLGSVDKNLHPAEGLIKGVLWVSSQWLPVRSEQATDQSWLGINPVVFSLFRSNAPLHLGKRSQRGFSFNILETGIHFDRN